VVENVRVRPGLRELAQLQPVVVSSGFHELIDPVLEREGVSLDLQANRIEASPDGWRPVWRELPVCSICGQPCKRSSFPPNGEVVYVGDGYSDRCGALAADRIFARRGLAAYLDELGTAYERFDDLTEIVTALEEGS
jgi:2-hydroxy-3-keto-5-methylthiopentenyl-1-phosphate phosphatase